MIKLKLSKLIVLSLSALCFLVALQISSCVSIPRESLPEMTKDDILEATDVIEVGVSTNREYVENLGVNRRIVDIPDLSKLFLNVKGQIAVNICVDPMGNVVYSKLLNEETTIKDKRIIKRAIDLSMKYKYEKMLKLTVDQCGKFMFKIDGKG